MKNDVCNNNSNFFNSKLKENEHYDFSTTSNLLSTITNNINSTKDNLQNNINEMWQNINTKTMKEKKKFNADVSDMLVIEVLKRKELLIENNTSRDLTFSENKRNAWNDVRTLLIEKFPYFDLNVEAIKSHWRYRKRKVTDFFQDLKCTNAEYKIQNKLSTIDFSIFQMLKELNMLDKCSKNEALSPINEKDDLDSLLEHNNELHQLNCLLQNTKKIQSSNNKINNFSLNNSNMIERLATIFLIQQQQKIQKQNHVSNTDFFMNLQSQSQNFTNFLSQSQYLKTEKKNDNNVNLITTDNGLENILNFENKSLIKLFKNEINTFNENDLEKNLVSSSLNATLAAVASAASVNLASCTSNNIGQRRKRSAQEKSNIVFEKRKNSCLLVDTKEHCNKEEFKCKSLEECQKTAFIAQRNAFLELRSTLNEFRTLIMPSIVSILNKLNAFFELKSNIFFPNLTNDLFQNNCFIKCNLSNNSENDSQEFCNKDNNNCYKNTKNNANKENNNNNHQFIEDDDNTNDDNLQFNIKPSDTLKIDNYVEETVEIKKVEKLLNIEVNDDKNILFDANDNLTLSNNFKNNNTNFVRLLNVEKKNQPRINSSIYSKNYDNSDLNFSDLNNNIKITQK